MYITTWYEMSCPGCKAINWLCDGDTSDCTVPDIEALQCWNCQKKTWLNEDCAHDIHDYEFEDDDSEYKSLDEYLEKAAYCDKGRKSPHDPLP